MQGHLLSGSRAGRQLLQKPAAPVVSLDLGPRPPEPAKDATFTVALAAATVFSVALYGFAGYGVYKFATRNR